MVKGLKVMLIRAKEPKREPSVGAGSVASMLILLTVILFLQAAIIEEKEDSSTQILPLCLEVHWQESKVPKSE